MSFTCSDKLSLGKDQVAIALTFGAFGRHVGLVFSDKGALKVAHMRFHLNAAVEEFPTKHAACWIASPLQIHPINAKTLIGHLNRIGSSSVRIAFGVNIRSSRGSFAANGSYEPPVGNDGLTCATFVNELCRSVGLPLVDEQTWDEDREEDRLWVEEVAQMLHEHKADPNHIAWVRGNADGLRVRPEEVAAPGNHKASRAGISFQAAKVEGPLLLEQLDKCCPDGTQRLTEIAKAAKKLSNPPLPLMPATGFRR